MDKTLFKSKKLDAILVTDPLNMRYLSGFSGGEGILYISEFKNVLITDSRYTEAASYESDFEIIEENVSCKRLEILLSLIKKEKAYSVGFEDLSLSYAEYKKYNEALQQVIEWIPMGNTLNNLRVIKTDYEIELMDKAQSIADEGFNETLKLIKAGMSELDGAAEIEYQMKKAGAEDISFNTIFAAGKNSSMPHAVPTSYKIRSGDLITIDFGCRYKGYCSDTTRTISVSEPSKKQKEIYDIVLAAHEKAMSVVRPGVMGSEVDSAARDMIKDAGYGSFFGHSTGHAVGLAIHEEPCFSPNNDTIYKPNMTGTIEPGIYLPGKFGVRVEDMIVVTKNSCRSFTKLTKKLIIL